MMVNNHWLMVTGTMEFGLTFPSYWEWNVIIPTDEVIIFQRGRSTTNQFFFAESLLRFHVFSKFGTFGGWPSFRVKGATDVNIPSRLGDRMGEKLLAASIS